MASGYMKFDFSCHVMISNDIRIFDGFDDYMSLMMRYPQFAGRSSNEKTDSLAMEGERFEWRRGSENTGSSAQYRNRKPRFRGNAIWQEGGTESSTR
jgi:hypothetical protein